MSVELFGATEWLTQPEAECNHVRLVCRAQRFPLSLIFLLDEEKSVPLPQGARVIKRYSLEVEF